MAKIRILSKQERIAFQSPPVFQSDERPGFFEMNDHIKKKLIRPEQTQTKLDLFYSLFISVARDDSSAHHYFINQILFFASESLDIDVKSIGIEKYKEHRVIDDQKNILEILGFQSFDRHGNGQSLLAEEITRLVSKQVRPKMIFYYLSNFFFQKKIAIPSYQQVGELIIKSMHDFEDKLLLIIESNISKQQMKELDQLLPKIGPTKTIKKEAHYAQEEQEMAMNCKILLQNSIVLWNYLHLSQLLATTESSSKREKLLEIIKNGSIMTWIHINMLGEYDFRNKPASNESIFDIEKILAWSAASCAENFEIRILIKH